MTDIKKIDPRSAVVGWMSAYACLLHPGEGVERDMRRLHRALYKQAKAVLAAVLAALPDQRYSDASGIYSLAVDPDTKTMYPTWAPAASRKVMAA